MGGSGAEVAATFQLQAGDELTVVVGAAGDGSSPSAGGGGGGGSAVIVERAGVRTLLLVAGGAGASGEGYSGGGGTSSDGTAGGGVYSGGGGGGGGGFNDAGDDSPLGNAGGAAGTLAGGGAGGSGYSAGGFGFGGGGAGSGGGGGGGGGFGGGDATYPASGGSSFVEAAGTDGFTGTGITRTDGVTGGGSNRNGEVSVVNTAITVNTLAGDDDGVCGTNGADPLQDCSIREAVSLANIDADMNRIVFSVSGTIPLGAIISLTEAVEIDGTTAPGGSGSVFLDGQDAVIDVIRISGGTGTIIRGLTIGRATGTGVAIFSPASGAQVVSNYIGTNAAGTDLGNAGSGLFVANGASNNTIGGAGAGNTIGFNGTHGVWLLGAGTTGNVVAGNFVGTNMAGADLSNAEIGVYLFNASGNTVGGTEDGAGNTVGFNGRSGISVAGSSPGSAAGNLVAGNFAGTNAAGADLGNGRSGIFIADAFDTTVGGTEAGAANTVGFNGEAGIVVAGFDFLATGNVVAGNFVGTNTAGDDLGNGLAGIIVQNTSETTVGGTDPAASNTVRFNAKGIEVYTDRI